MSIIALHQVNLSANPANLPASNHNLCPIPEEIGRALCLNTRDHFRQFLGQRALGFSYNSCNAGLAVNLHAQYGQVNLAQPKAMETRLRARRAPQMIARNESVVLVGFALTITPRVKLTQL
jgi:hypothetical protein